MRTLDETDLEILRLLLEDARRPYNDIADRVDVSAPTVSDRIDRLQEFGVIDGFTVQVDRTAFTDGIELLIDVDLNVTLDHSVVDRFARVDGIEHVFLTSDSRLLAFATIRSDQVSRTLTDALDVDAIDSYRVHLVEDRAWQPTVTDSDPNRSDERDDIDRNGETRLTATHR